MQNVEYASSLLNAYKTSTAVQKKFITDIQKTPGNENLTMDLVVAPKLYKPVAVDDAKLEEILKANLKYLEEFSQGLRISEPKNVIINVDNESQRKALLNRYTRQWLLTKLKTFSEKLDPQQKEYFGEDKEFMLALTKDRLSMNVPKVDDVLKCILLLRMYIDYRKQNTNHYLKLIGKKITSSKSPATESTNTKSASSQQSTPASASSTARMREAGMDDRSSMTSSSSSAYDPASSPRNLSPRSIDNDDVDPLSSSPPVSPRAPTTPVSAATTHKDDIDLDSAFAEIDQLLVDSGISSTTTKSPTQGSGVFDKKNTVRKVPELPMKSTAQQQMTSQDLQKKLIPKK